MTKATRCLTAFVLLALVAGCAAGRAARAGQQAAERGDWDTAVAYYRQALVRDPSRVDVRIALQRAMVAAAAEHVRRAREFESQEQLAGAVAEYRLAAELDPTNTLALAKALELERVQRERIEAARPPSQLDLLRDQARERSTIPTLDPRINVTELRFSNASIRDILNAIAAFSNPPVNVTYAQSAEAFVNRSYSIEVQDLSLEEAFNQVLTNNNLAFKVVNQRTIVVFADTPAEHSRYDDLYTQVFYLSNVEPADMINIIMQTTTTTTNTSARPVCAPQKTTTAITCRATGPIINLIDRLVKANDKPKAEVLIEVEILEVDRAVTKELGLDLQQYALGFAFSPELAPPNTSGTFPPATPPPFNLNTVSEGFSANDFYVTVPTAVVRLLEADSRTRTLAKPSVRGAEGAQITMNLGDRVPVLNSVIPATTTGIGLTTAPVTSFTYQPVGVNLTITPRVTFDDEIVLDPLSVQNNAIGGTINVGGTALQTFSDRIVSTALRLRNGESTLLAGLLREREASDTRGLVGLARIPILRNIFGFTSGRAEQSDIIVVITPHIVRSHELTAEDLQPMYIGTQQNLGQTGVPPLISPEVPIPGGVTPPAAGPAGAQAPAPAAPPTQPTEPPPMPPAQPATIAVFVPGAGFQSGSLAPYTVPITAANLPEVGTLTLRVTYNPMALRAQAAVPGTFMNQGNVTAAFVPSVNPDAGTVDLVFSRPVTASGASGSGLLGSIQFQAMSPGSSQISVSGTATAPDGQPVAVQFAAATVVVR